MKFVYSFSKKLIHNIIKMNITNKISFINSEQSRQIDELLMSKEVGYSIDQLMEIAGLSVAIAINHAILNNNEWKNIKKILNVSGPGSNLII
jgi:NAD(P)H-hydrate repair Nnr-like enzyme with NAD(P)H-hydrate epimerase domain